MLEQWYKEHPDALLGKGMNKQSLKRQWTLLTGEYEAGNDALIPQIRALAKKLHKMGIFTQKLYNDALMVYRN